MTTRWWCAAGVLLLSACLDTTSPTEGVVRGTPAGWSASAGTQDGIGLDTKVRHGGANSLLISGSGNSTQSATLAQSIRADAYLGKRVRWSAWLKAVTVHGSYAGLWMRVDGAGTVLAFDNMQARPDTGTRDWQEFSVVLDVPANAMGISLGVLFNASGSFHADDMRLEVVNLSTPVTDQLTAPTPGSDSLTVLSLYSTKSDRPLNLDFEGLPAITQATINWLATKGTPLASTSPNAALTDLAPFGAMVGNAHVVGLGEATHGTSDFFLLKHRLIKYLVTQKGFTHFAMEATAPEAADLDRYLQTGVGDLKVLLSHLYFWTWNTQEVLDLISWMREWNVSAPADRRIRFSGFDIQYQGASMDSVEAYIARVDAPQAGYVRSRYSCMDLFRNHGSAPGFYKTNYAAKLATSKAACAVALKDVYDLMALRSATYSAASSADEFAVMLHHARLVQQFEAHAAVSNNSFLSSASRDSAMAENVKWIRGRAGSDARLVLWAHNQHVNNIDYTMGRHLRAAYSDDYLSLGFAFAKGTFNAVSTLGEITLWRTDYVLPGSFEAAFQSTGKPLLLLDTRTIAAGGTAAAALAGPIRMRSFGSSYSAQSEPAYFASHTFPNDFDFLLFVASTVASTRLPFVD